MTTTSRTCSSPAELLAAVIAMLGYCPSESLVLLPLTGNSGAATLRFDLPSPTASRAEIERYAGAVLGYAMHVDDVDAIACLVFVDEAVSRPPCRSLVTALTRVGDRMGLHMFSPLYRAENGWGRYERGSGRGASRVEPLSLLGAIGLLTPSSPPHASLEPAPDDIAVTTAAPRLRGLDPHAVVEQLLSSPEARVHPDDAGEVFGGIRNALSSARVRDELLAMIAFGEDGNAALAALRGHVFLGTDAETYDASALHRAYDPDRCERALPIFREVARRCEGAERGMVLSALAWLHWALGHGSMTMSWSAQSLDHDAGNTLARLLESAARAGVVAPWFGKPPRRVHAQHDAA